MVGSYRFTTRETKMHVVCERGHLGTLSVAEPAKSCCRYFMKKGAEGGKKVDVEPWIPGSYNVPPSFS